MKHFNNTKAYLKKFWENPSLWNQYNIDEKDYQERLLAIKKMVPRNINTVVDVGCGKGDVLRAIEAGTKIALDISETALMHIKDKNIVKIKGNIIEFDKLLPDSVNQVDLLICLEVLEHLLEDELKKAVKNILGLKPKFLLIGVPFKEPLARRSFYCNNCSKPFNVDTHFRVFNKKDCCDLFGEKYSLLKEIYAGESYPRFHSYFYMLKNRYIKPDEFAICYHCGNDSFISNHSFWRRLIRYFIGKAERLLSFVTKKHPYWMLLLFEYREKND